MTAGHTKQDDAQFESGERCLICYERTAEPYGRPGACEDCFMGSGTVAKMAERNGRKWIGSEISAEYCAIAEKRIAAETVE